MVAANAQHAVRFKISAGQDGDGPQGRELIADMQSHADGAALLMDMAYEGNETRKLVRELGYTAVVPSHPNRAVALEYDKILYRRRNEVERLFRNLKGFRRIFTRYDKLDAIFCGFIHIALIFMIIK